MGRITFELMKDGDELDTNVQTIVVSKSNLDLSEINNVHLADSPKHALKLLEKQNFKEAFLAGRGNLNSSFMEQGLIDEIIVDLHPHIIGTGVPIFNKGKFDYKLELINTQKLSPSVTQFHYKVVK